MGALRRGQRVVLLRSTEVCDLAGNAIRTHDVSSVHTQSLARIFIGNLFMYLLYEFSAFTA